MNKKFIKKLIGRAGLRTYHHLKSHSSAMYYNYPARGMKVIGITGTNGKTTTANIVASIFEAAGYKVALLTTIQFRINGKESINSMKMTAPSASDMNKFILKAKDAGCNILIVEATSHALDQHRFAGINFDTGVLTNITHDHLDYHLTFANYVQSKRQLFARGLRLSVLNIDDKSGKLFLTEPAEMHLIYSLKSHPKSVSLLKVTKGSEYNILDIFNPLTNRINKLQTKLFGDFNYQNILAAYSVALGFNIEMKHIYDGIKSIEFIPGRMESVELGQNFKVIIDYAHTPDALEKMYKAINDIYKSSRMISVLGACGDRDKTKRPILGSIAGKNADYIIVTNEDPYTEEPQQIIDSVASGIELGNNNHKIDSTYWKIFDRREAIAKAFSLAKEGDVVTITGKGAETTMLWGNEPRPWSDKQVVKEELENI
jgi:UDP-N-acetylmuramoyl-L-alanyl-D-glutamate--2,6-diaminopimelate ligase